MANITVLTTLDDPEWDAFVANTEGGHHVQTSLWAQIKAQLGWRPLRIVVKNQNSIVGGCQILLHSIPMGGEIGYVTKGPLCAMEDPKMITQIIEQLLLLRKAHNIKMIAVQPPDNGEYINPILAEYRFCPSTLELAPRASIVIDVAIDESLLFHQVSKSTRNNINHSRRAGVVVRTGSQEDLHTFCRLHVNTSKRQNFLPYQESYFVAMHRILGSYGYIQLLFAEIEGEPVAAALLVPFRDTTILKLVGWSGQHAEARPNAGLVWGTLLWARTHGYHYVDLEGVDLEGARTFLSGGPLPESFTNSYYFWKYGYGGKVVIFPEPCDLVFNPACRWLFHRVNLQVAKPTAVSKVVDLFRKR